MDCSRPCSLSRKDSRATRHSLSPTRERVAEGRLRGETVFEETYGSNRFKRVCSRSSMHSLIRFINSVGAFRTIPLGNRSTLYPLLANSLSRALDPSSTEPRKRVLHRRVQQPISKRDSRSPQSRFPKGLGGETCNAAPAGPGEASRRASRPVYLSDAVFGHETSTMGCLRSLGLMTFVAAWLPSPLTPLPRWGEGDRSP